MDVPALDDPRVHVSIPVPVKGRKTPWTLRLPRFDFMEESAYDEMIAAAEAAQAAEDTPRKRDRAANLAMIKCFVSAKDHAVCDGLASGQLSAVMLIWAEKSSVSLGELLASAPSSMATTEAPSSSTSTPAAGRAETSDAA